MKVLITGGSGFIGSTLADRLLDRGDEVLVIDNFQTGRRDNLKSHPNLKVVEGTIADEALVNKEFEEFKPQVVVHAACSYKDPDNWVEDAATNMLGTNIVIKAAEANDVSRIIYYQTALCYGLKPMEQPITLDHPLILEGSSYAISKTAAERYMDLSSLDYISFRLANAYGPRNISGPLPTFFHRLSDDKPCFVVKTRRDFIYIDDLVDCTMLAVDGKGTRGAYHISSGSDFSILELYDATRKAMNLPHDPDVEQRERCEDDAYTILLDPSKTNEDFGWKTTTQLDDGVKKAVDYYKEYGITETYTHLKLEGHNE